MCSSEGGPGVREYIVRNIVRYRYSTLNASRFRVWSTIEYNWWYLGVRPLAQRPWLAIPNTQSTAPVRPAREPQGIPSPTQPATRVRASARASVAVRSDRTRIDGNKHHAHEVLTMNMETCNVEQ